MAAGSWFPGGKGARLLSCGGAQLGCANTRGDMSGDGVAAAGMRWGERTCRGRQRQVGRRGRLARVRVRTARRTQQVPRLTVHSSERQGSPQEAGSTCMSTSPPPHPGYPSAWHLLL